MESLCAGAKIPFEVNDRILDRISGKDSCLVAGVFRKYREKLLHGKNHVVLVNPSDSGNIGTIIRSSVGFGIHDLAIVEPAVDVFHPKTVRASMGALFHMRFCYFQDFEAYIRQYGSEREMYPFMLKGENQLGELEPPKDVPFSLIFGNESSGLDDTFLHVGKSVLIGHSKEIDSLNLSLATGIGIYEFTKKAMAKSQEA